MKIEPRKDRFIVVYLFLADGFEEIEALTPVDVLRRGNIDIKTVGIGSNQIKGSHGIVVTTDMTDSDIYSFNDVEAVILPGGIPGTPNLEANPTVIEAIKFCHANNRIIGAICAAPSILGHLGFLENKKATAFPSFQKELHGAVLSKDYVVSDENIVTARGMGVSLDFALKLLELLKDADTASSVRMSVQCQ